MDVSNADAVDLFGGPGGWDLAARGLGISVTGIEKDHAACETRRAAGLGTVEGDVRDYGPHDFPKARYLKIGSPPCQPYAINGLGKGRQALDNVLALAKRMANREDISRDLAAFEDERIGLVLEPLRWALQAIDQQRPYEAITLEQVPTVQPVWDALAIILRAEGYSVATGKLSAEEYGVPQTRVRAIFVARLHGVARLPAPTHRKYRKNVAQEDGDQSLRPWVSMAQGIGWGMTHRPGLTVTVGTGAGGADPSCVGGSGARATLYGERDAGRWVAFNRLMSADDLPAYKGGRKDQIRVYAQDAALLQSFEMGHPFQGSRTEVLTQIGNAFPPRMAEQVLLTALELRPSLRSVA
ncbi:DNA cytosine methyltransferase [Streptomyces sp. WAC 06738]|uniref:DNA cytosine methyltransferase n=1 Tax=Streptomyces sp. WAC 06738 TaxID=2203210 RepID=UPI000F6D78D9|nr:DNA cytosine methyltransferase [Streptomyces sp. WAC 06738]AZM47861.1 DNA cytosine methyltransferase [Streptomyces sp. WAC 06738]